MSAWAEFFVVISRSAAYNPNTMQLPFDFNFNRYTFSGILIGIVMVAIARAYFGF